MGVDNRLRWASYPHPEAISEIAGTAVDSVCQEVHAFRKNQGPRDLFAVLLLSAEMEGWDFDRELQEGRKIAARPGLTRELPKATRRGKPGDLIKAAVEGAKEHRDPAKIKSLISRMPGGFNRFVLMKILNDVEDV